MIPKVRAAKARGKKLGGLRPGTLPRIEAIRAKADSDAKMAMMAIGPLRAAGRISVDRRLPRRSKKRTSGRPEVAPGLRCR